ncbi:MAG: adenosine kinase [Acidimicrobiia bacterium]
MSSKKYAVVGMGNAIVDVIAQVEDYFPETYGLDRGAMRLVDAAEVERLYSVFPQGIEISGGSAANTIVGIASFGGNTGFIGKVRDDQFGEIFAHDMAAVGVSFSATPATSGDPTARCLVAVTPDAQRTMNTYLGIAGNLTPADVDTELIAQAELLYCEGYLWDTEDAKAAIRYGMEVAHANGGRSALTLSDGFCVDRHREEFLELIHTQVDVLFANEVEILSLYETDSLDEAIAQVRGTAETICITRSEKGSLILIGEETHHIPVHPVEQIVDSTGAGDLYAAGVLWGLAMGYPPATCGRLGAMAAAEVISHIGARPRIPLSVLAREVLAGSEVV